MKYISRELKGTFGYIHKQRIFEIIKTIILFAMAFGIYVIGYATLGTKKSLWTIFAVLAMLPACKSMVGVIMFARYSSLEQDLYEKYQQLAGGIGCIYENVLTTSKKSYYLPIIACADNTVVGLMNTKNASDVKDVSEHLQTVLHNAGHKGATVKIFDKDEGFEARLKQMSDNLSGVKTKSSEAIFTTIKAVSL